MSWWDAFWDWLIGAPAGRKLPSADGDVATMNADDDEIGEWWAQEGVTQTEPQPIEDPGLSTEALALRNILFSHLDGHDLTLPPLPRVAERVLRQLSVSDYKVPEVAHEIEEDGVTAAAVLRMANSPLFRGINPINAIEPAVSRLGGTAIRTLMMQQALRAATHAVRGKMRRYADMVWKRSLVSAHVMGRLSKFTEVETSEAYLIGLLHDIGNVVVVREAAKQMAVLRCDMDVESFEYLCHESHQEFGELLAREWNLSETLTSLVSNHHTPPGPDDPLRTHRLMLELADMITSIFGYGPDADYLLMESRAVRGLGLDGRDDFLPFLRVLPYDVDENVEFY